MPVGGARIPTTEYRSSLDCQVTKFVDPIPSGNYLKLVDHFLYGDDPEIIAYNGFPDVQQDIARLRAGKFLAQFVLMPSSPMRLEIDQKSFN